MQVETISVKGHCRVVEENLVGKKLGDYILREKLTSGGMAHIYLGDDEKLQRRAAIKILTSDMAGDDTILRERFEREARAVAQLEHDSIVPIYQFGEEGSIFFIAMRYIEGNDLADEMKKYKERGEYMPVERMLSIMEQVAGALDHAHKRGIIHRDVKPSNVLLRAPQEGETGDKAVLTDFGLVLWEDVDKTLGTAFGTPRYISPEQATDSQTALAQSDIYSLAVIVYEILTGEVLFKGNTPMEVALSHITELPKPPRAYNTDIPVNAQREILKALQKDAGKRHTTAMRFIGALKEAYNLHDTGTKPPTAPKLDVATKPMRDDDFTPVAKPGAPEDVATRPKIERPAPVVQEKKPEKASELPKVFPISKPDSGFKEPEVKKEKSGGMLLPVLGGGGLIAIVVAVAFAMGLFDSGGAGGQSGAINMEIRYNEDFFAIANISENATLDISGLRVTGESGASGRNYGTELGPGECRFVRRDAAQDGNIPDGWNCEGTAASVISNDDLYWRAEEEADDNFTLINDTVVITSCNTAGRVVGHAGDNTCRIAWPDYTTVEESE